jgi:hypothetical protein
MAGFNPAKDMTRFQIFSAVNAKTTVFGDVTARILVATLQYFERNCCRHLVKHFSETLVPIHRNARFPIPENHIFQVFDIPWKAYRRERLPFFPLPGPKRAFFNTVESVFQSKRTEEDDESDT